MGIEANSRLAASFVVSKLKEYRKLKRKIKEKLKLLERRGYVKIVLVGPEIVNDFVDKMIKEHALNLVMVGHCNSLDHLRTYDIDSYDVALVMDGNSTDAEAMSEDREAFKNKLLPLW